VRRDHHLRPTPLRKTKEPDVSFILAAAEQIQQRLRRGQLIILESTTYPGTTDESLVANAGRDRLEVWTKISCWRSRLSASIRVIPIFRRITFPKSSAASLMIRLKRPRIYIHKS